MKEKSKRTYIVKAYLSAEEYAQVQKSSELARLSISNFTRNVCLGSKIASREDAQARRELLKVNGDLGRLGGLLKQAISKSPNEKIFIVDLLKQIEMLQLELKDKVKAI